MTFADHFSDHAHRYLAYRPTYPDELFTYLDSIVAGHDLAWDCATGNGQAALQLALHFRSIVASDASPRQLALAPRQEKISYVIALAHRTPLADGSADLVTVASACHWLDLPRFYAEVRRVARPGGIIACWGYKVPSVTPEVDAVTARFDVDVLRGCWLPETRMAAEGYRTMPFPFDEIAAPPFRLTQDWDLEHFMGFLGTWSASLRYLTQTGRDPIDEIREELAEVWGAPAQARRVTWDLHVRVGRVGPG